MELAVVAGVDDKKDDGGGGKRWRGREDKGRGGHGSVRKSNSNNEQLIELFCNTKYLVIVHFDERQCSLFSARAVKLMGAAV